MKRSESQSCSCTECQTACKRKPGYPMPDEIPEILKHFNAKSIDELIEHHGFTIDWYDNYGVDAVDVLILSPNIKGNEGQLQFPSHPAGECVFYKNGKCEIHAVKPFECWRFLNDPDRQEYESERLLLAEKWSKSNLLDKYKGTIDTSWDSLKFQINSPFNFHTGF